MGRVKVKYPWLSQDHASDWARVVIPGGGTQRGMQFLPEVNDEVLVGFEQGDINFPVRPGRIVEWQERSAEQEQRRDLAAGRSISASFARALATSSPWTTPTTHRASPSSTTPAKTRSFWTPEATS